MFVSSFDKSVSKLHLIVSESVLKTFQPYLSPVLNIGQKCVDIIILNCPAHVIFVKLSSNCIYDHMIIDN